MNMLLHHDTLQMSKSRMSKRSKKNCSTNEKSHENLKPFLLTLKYTPPKKVKVK